DAGDDIQHFEQYGPLAPGTAGVDLELAESGLRRRLDRHAEAREILCAQQALVLPVIGEDRLRDVAAVERVARRLEPGLTATPGGRAFRIRHVLQRAPQVALHEQLSGPPRRSARTVR